MLPHGQKIRVFSVSPLNPFLLQHLCLNAIFIQFFFSLVGSSFHWKLKGGGMGGGGGLTETERTRRYWSLVPSISIRSYNRLCQRSGMKTRTTFQWWLVSSCKQQTSKNKQKTSTGGNTKLRRKNNNQSVGYDFMEKFKLSWVSMNFKETN